METLAALKYIQLLILSIVQYALTWQLNKWTVRMNVFKEK